MTKSSEIGRSEGAKPRPEEARNTTPKDAADHGLQPGQNPSDPPDKGTPAGEKSRPRDTGRQGA